MDEIWFKGKLNYDACDQDQRIKVIDKITHKNNLM